MYYAMRGMIEKTLLTSVIINVHDISYEVLTSHPEDFIVNEETKIYLYEVVREDDHYLVGFSTLEEKDVFMSLISVKGIGPKTALSCLSKTTPNEFIAAIENSNIQFLKKLPGIGAKAAQQIVLDLKGHLTMVENAPIKKNLSLEQQEACEALKLLGFKRNDIENVLEKIDCFNKGSEDILKEALQLLRK